MEDYSILVSNICKNYHIYNYPNKRLKQSISSNMSKYFKIKPRKYYDEHCALKNINFEIRKGETIGIIGKNGSGKSTLLQIICGTLAATSGNVEINGRLAALLELGSGFNPEFTGKENVFLNASILGLGNEEIEAIYEDICNFADIGEFINKPVKLYSTGMALRLAFSVIAHVNADILVIDEALAVGDIVFTKKCIKFLESFANKGGTILLVSHDLGSIHALCDRALWIADSEIKTLGDPKDTINNYLKYCIKSQSEDDDLKISEENNSVLNKNENESYVGSDINSRISITNFDGLMLSNKNFEILKVDFECLDKNDINNLKGGELVKFTVECFSYIEINQVIIGFELKNRLGQIIFGDNNSDPLIHDKKGVTKNSKFKISYEYIFPSLANGQYSFHVAVADGTTIDHKYICSIEDALIINIISNKDSYGIFNIRKIKKNLVNFK